jgi:hypothetical protein
MFASITATFASRQPLIANRQSLPFRFAENFAFPFSVHRLKSVSTKNEAC